MQSNHVFLRARRSDLVDKQLYPQVYDEVLGDAPCCVHG